MILKTFYASAREKYSIHLAAGAEGLNRQITWFHIIEDSILSTFIHGEELIFTAGLLYQNEEWLTNLIKKLFEHNACGIVINLGPYIEYLPAQIISFCDQNNFPLFTIPWKIKLVDVTRHLSQMILETERTRIQSISAFKNLMLFPESVDSVKIQLAEVGYHYDSDYCVALVSATHATLKSKDIMKNIKQVVSGIYENAVVFSLNTLIVIVLVSPGIDDTRNFVKTFDHAISKTFEKGSLHMGISKNRQGINSIYSSKQQAKWALELAKANNMNYVFYEDTGLYKLLFPCDKQLLKEFTDEVLGPILNYDKAHKTDYLKWLKLYLECDGSIQKIAEKAFCHRNTVNYKLKRMRELFNINTDSIRENAMILTAIDIIFLADFQE